MWKQEKMNLMEFEKFVQIVNLLMKHKNETQHDLLNHLLGGSRLLIRHFCLVCYHK